MSSEHNNQSESGDQATVHHSSMASQHSEDAQNNFTLFGKISQVVQGFHRAFQARLNLSAGEWRFLMLLLQHHQHLATQPLAGNQNNAELVARIMNEGISQKEMQELLGIDRAMVTRLAKQFEADGLIRRAPDPKDNRLTMLYLTEAGVQMHYDIPHKLAAFWVEALEGMSAAELQNLHHALEHLGANLAAMVDTDAPEVEQAELTCAANH